MSTNTDRLSEITARRAKLPPEPWNLSVGWGLNYQMDYACIRDAQGHYILETNIRDRPVAEFITHAPADVDWLVGEVERSHAEVERLRTVLALLPRSREEIGRRMHESWSQTKRAHGFHGPDEPFAPGVCDSSVAVRCSRFHADLIPWDALPERQKDINRHALDAILGPVLDALEEGQDA